MRRTVLAFCVLSAAAIYACRTASQPPAANSNPELEEHLDHDVQEVLETIKGRENEPAEKVFKNIQLLKGVPASRLLRIMNVGYSRGLGVECEHCHVEEYWEVDEKRPKRAAREMIVMTRALNEQLGSMPHLEADEATVNCATCHRGEVRPGSSVSR